MNSTSRKNTNHVYDYAIIGSGLSGLCLANAISRISSNVILIDGNDTFGGFNRSIQTPVGASNNGLRFLPANELSQKAISFLELLLNTSLNPQVAERPPLTFESGGLRPFVGFGEKQPDFYEEISYFTSPSTLLTSLETHEWVQILFSHYTGEFSPRSYVTKVNVEDGQAQSILINGQKKIQALNFVYCGTPQRIPQLFSEQTTSQKSKSKSSWTGLCLDLVHATQVTDNEALHILNGTTQDEVGPCAGKFIRTDAGAPQLSQWMTFIDSEESEDTERIGACLKKIKRQVKRAFPDALDGLKYERIVVIPEMSGATGIKLNANQALNTAKNFWVGSGGVSPHRNIVGALLQAELVASALGCHPAGTQVETTSIAAENNEQPAET